MRKLVLCLVAALGFALTANAQEAVKKTTQTTTNAKVDAKPIVVKEKQKVTLKSDDKKVVTKNGVVLKKDGTPDKRYKKKAVVMKKDGTPDKRYKENK